MVYRPRPCAVPRTPATTARKTIAIVFGKVWTPLQGADRGLSLAHAKTDKQVVSLFFFSETKPSAVGALQVYHLLYCIEYGYGSHRWLAEAEVWVCFSFRDRSMLCLFHAYEHDWIERWILAWTDAYGWQLASSRFASKTMRLMRRKRHDERQGKDGRERATVRTQTTNVDRPKTDIVHGNVVEPSSSIIHFWLSFFNSTPDLKHLFKIV